MKRPKHCEFCGRELEEDIFLKKYDRYTGDEVYGLICPEWNAVQKEIDDEYKQGAEESISLGVIPTYSRSNLHDKLFDELFDKL